MARVSAGSDGTSAVSEPEGFDPKIADVVRRLDKLRKSPAEVLALFRSVRNGRDLATAGWSPEEVLTALELMCLCALREAHLNPLLMPSEAIATAAQWYSEVIKLRWHEMIAEMWPDYLIGRKVREKGKATHPSWSARYRQAEKFRELDSTISKAITSKKERHKRIAAKALGTPKAYKTVERRLKEFPVPLAIFELGFGRKID
jgi:hypothetical protein